MVNDLVYSPSSLDALVFSYTAPLLKAPLNSNQLTNHLHSFCENLCLHTRRILREFFPLSQEGQLCFVTLHNDSKVRRYETINQSCLHYGSNTHHMSFYEVRACLAEWSALYWIIYWLVLLWLTYVSK